MSRTFEPDHLLPLLIDAFGKEGHFVLAKQGKVFVRVITEKGGESSSTEFCLSDVAAHAAERLSQ